MPVEDVKILFENPPIISEVRDIFRLPPGMIFAYSPFIYNPSRMPIDEHLYKHECHHIQQQGNDPAKWWRRYLSDSPFRARQEIPAYQIQYQSVKRIAKDRNKLHNYLVALAKDLSGEMYSNLMTFNEAMDAIKNPKLFDFKV